MTQPPEPPPPPDDAWPTPDDPTVISSRETVVGGPPPEPVGPPPDRRIGAGMLLALGALALVALGILIAWYLTHRDDDKGTTTVTTVQTATTAAKVAVPDLTGKTFPEAQATLDAAGLHTAKKPVSSDQPAGIVVEPEAGGRVERRQGLDRDALDRVGDDLHHDLDRCDDDAVRTTTQPATTTAADAPTTTAPTTTAPPQPTTAKVPDVTGQTEAAAATAMNRAGILASIVFVPGAGSARDRAPAGEAGRHDRAVPLARADQRVEGAERDDGPHRPERGRTDADAGGLDDERRAAAADLRQVPGDVRFPDGQGRAADAARAAARPRRTPRSSSTSARSEQ